MTGIGRIESCSLTKNISRSGMRLQVSRLVKKGDTLSLAISSPEKKDPAIEAMGRIVWTRESGDFELDAGLEFTKIDPHDAGRLVAVI